MILKNIKTLTVISFSLILCACGGNKPEEIDDTDNIDTTSVNLNSKDISAENVFNSIPGREKIITLTQNAHAEYNYAFLNNPDNVNKYTIESSKALNLGTYGADLNVTSVFEQSQESMLFLKCVNGLAKSIGVSNAFDEKMIDRIEKNKENRDSTLDIISQAFKNADTYLKSNGRPGTSSLIVAGAWIEGMYIACSTAKETKNEDVVKEIFNQKESLKHLLELLEYSKIMDDAKYVLEDLISLKELLDAKTDNNFTINALKTMDVKITDIRTKIISAK